MGCLRLSSLKGYKRVNGVYDCNLYFPYEKNSQRWEDYPHLRCRRSFATVIRPRAELFHQWLILQEPFQEPSCRLCCTGAYLADDLGGPKHWTPGLELAWSFLKVCYFFGLPREVLSKGSFYRFLVGISRTPQDTPWELHQKPKQQAKLLGIDRKCLERAPAAWWKTSDERARR